MIIDFIGWMSSVLSNFSMPVIALAVAFYVVKHRGA